MNAAQFAGIVDGMEKAADWQRPPGSRIKTTTMKAVKEMKETGKTMGEVSKPKVDLDAKTVVTKKPQVAKSAPPKGPTAMQRMSSTNQALQKTPRAPMSTGKKVGLGLAAAGGALAVHKALQSRKEKQQNAS